jgi:acyl dehydratase
MAGSGAALADPGLGLNYAMVVHGEQRFSYTRPLGAGDVVTAQVTLTEIRDVVRNVMVTTSTDITTVTGELVCTAFSTIVERGA